MPVHPKSALPLICLKRRALMQVNLKKIIN
jgi:hypothetical protein